ncbi:hypothetical protein [Arcobacter roscoffensis]|uniref:Uncharacterized protein n=1 Tax=Arcobacter roscoffensis TaxID=2961520 RepID=A0ABY5E4S0_9BACT|nr:hypothetical protein [Arcobacter roscoffensis]UTJ05723.1 hypothetical protein NJU99_10670 [Arcobacter roscoffensis]
MAIKNIVIGGFTKEQREKELEKTKVKLSKKGYKFLKFEEKGALKSVAIFEVDEAILKKEKSMQLIVVGVGFMIIAAILYF